MSAGVDNGRGVAKTVDLQGLAARLSEVGPYSYEDARDDMLTLITMVRQFEEQRAVVAHLIKLALRHGTSQGATDRLKDALSELGQSD